MYIHKLYPAIHLCSCSLAKNPCLLLPSLFYNGSPTGLMPDWSVKSVTMAQQLVIVELIVQLMYISYLYYISMALKLAL